MSKKLPHMSIKLICAGAFGVALYDSDSIKWILQKNFM